MKVSEPDIGLRSLFHEALVWFSFGLIHYSAFSAAKAM